MEGKQYKIVNILEELTKLKQDRKPSQILVQSLDSQNNAILKQIHAYEPPICKFHEKITIDDLPENLKMQNLEKRLVGICLEEKCLKYFEPFCTLCTEDHNHSHLRFDNLHKVLMQLVLNSRESILQEDQRLNLLEISEKFKNLSQQVAQEYGAHIMQRIDNILENPQSSDNLINNCQNIKDFIKINTKSNSYREKITISKKGKFQHWILQKSNVPDSDLLEQIEEGFEYKGTNTINPQLLLSSKRFNQGVENMQIQLTDIINEGVNDRLIIGIIKESHNIFEMYPTSSNSYYKCLFDDSFGKNMISIGQGPMFENESFGKQLKKGDIITLSLDCVNGKFSINAPNLYHKKYITVPIPQLKIIGNAWRFFIGFYGATHHIKLLRQQEI